MSDVLICLFSNAGYDRAAEGVAGAGRRLATQLGGRLHAVAVGEVNSELNASLATIADTVVVADQAELAEYQPEACLEALTYICRQHTPGAILFSNDTYSQELAPRLAHRLGGSAAGDGIDIAVEGDSVRVKRSVYGGKAMATLLLKRAPAVVWLRSRAFDPASPRSEATASIANATAPLSAETRTRIIERKVEASDEARLEDARIIVSGGRGLGGPEPFEELKKIAGILGAQMGASRAACDSGWVPPSWQIGQTGKKVAPGLYLAVAIHGASQHLAGMSDAKVVAAINIDKDAPIFKHCRFGIVEDYRKVVPLLIEKLSALK